MPRPAPPPTHRRPRTARIRPAKTAFAAPEAVCDCPLPATAMIVPIKTRANPSPTARKVRDGRRILSVISPSRPGGAGMEGVGFVLPPMPEPDASKVLFRSVRARAGAPWDRRLARDRPLRPGRGRAGGARGGSGGPGRRWGRHLDGVVDRDLGEIAGVEGAPLQALEDVGEPDRE